MTPSSDQRQPARRAVIEPTHVIRKRRPKPLSDFSELFRPEEPAPEEQEDGRGEGWERVPVAERTATTAPQAKARTRAADPATEEFPPFPRQPPDGRRPGPGRSARYGRRGWSGRAAVVTVAGAAVAGFGIALALTWGGTDEPSRAAVVPPPAPAAPSSPPVSAPPTTAPPTTAPPVAPPPTPVAPDVLRQGDTGPQVSDLQERLLRIPDVYTGGTVTGAYDATLTEAVGRFQLWYGIRGDETGVYGDDTRRDLESRTG
ncbi:MULTISPECIES: peptidoglycan-binding protein [unclassified Streptomyces]|uniref:peptidoglycan-binding domain-containing protein n=1 Tax=unclassified Streptomyces TaxID=2593676 RepID=UPI003826BFEA